MKIVEGESPSPSGHIEVVFVERIEYEWMQSTFVFHEVVKDGGYDSEGVSGPVPEIDYNVALRFVIRLWEWTTLEPFFQGEHPYQGISVLLISDNLTVSFGE